MQVYVIVICSMDDEYELSPNIVLEEGYKTYEDALKFIQSRQGYPERFKTIRCSSNRDYEFLDVETLTRYAIVEVDIK